MEETQAFEAAGHALQGPHKDPRQPDLPLGFVPLELTLLPAGPSVELDRPDMVIGRHSGADIRLALPDVSRRHCRLVFQHGFWKIIDLNSMNGIFVNDERMQEATLYEGDQVRLGGFTFLVRLVTQPRIVSMSEAHAAASESNVLQQIAEVLPRNTELDQRKAS
jgi:pSer/pThr/pTyr-binding forkhead associated (FHA) protein